MGRRTEGAPTEVAERPASPPPVAAKEFDWQDFQLPATMIPALLADATTDIERIFYRGQRRLQHKWVHYLPLYDRYLSRYRGTPVRMLEIGVFEGGSLELWRSYLGGAATIVGVDIDPACADMADPPTHVRIGSQDDPQFLASVVAKLGPFDVVLDDGSHVGRHQRTSFETLFPTLADGGLYIIEDTHTAYWESYEGGADRSDTAFDLARQVIDDMHAWYHSRPTVTAARDAVTGVHVHDSIIVIEKGRRARPANIKVPGLEIPSRTQPS